MYPAIIFLLVAVGSGVLWVIESNAPRSPHFESLAYFPSTAYAIGLALVIFVTLPTSALAGLFAMIRRKKNPVMAIVITILALMAFGYSASVFLKFAGAFLYKG